jgi:MbtH protein
VSTERRYRVVVNHEDQYSVWPCDRELPAGWTDEGTQGDRESCLKHIDQVWTDMRPRSLRDHMAKLAAS